jgi:hypothetical protein
MSEDWIETIRDLPRGHLEQIAISAIAALSTTVSKDHYFLSMTPQEIFDYVDGLGTIIQS